MFSIEVAACALRIHSRITRRLCKTATEHRTRLLERIKAVTAAIANRVKETGSIVVRGSYSRNAGMTNAASTINDKASGANRIASKSRAANRGGRSFNLLLESRHAPSEMREMTACRMSPAARVIANKRARYKLLLRLAGGSFAALFDHDFKFVEQTSVILFKSFHEIGH